MSKNIKSREIGKHGIGHEADAAPFEGEKALRKSGINIIGDISWGTHLCLFYQSKEDLIDILAPYFKTGLENNEFCMWVASEPISVEEAKNAMERVMPDFEQYFKKGQIEILPYAEWYLKGGVFNLRRVLNAWIDKLNQALSKGFNGIRVTGNTAWLEKRNWEDFTNYEEEVNKAIGKYRMLAICTYSLDKCGASEVINVISNHQTALIRRQGKWEFIESSGRKKAAEELKEAEEKFKTIFDGASDGMLLADLETKKFLMGNKTISQMLGYSPEEIKNLGVRDIHPEKDLPAVLEQFEKQRKGEFTLAKDVPTKRKDGSVFYADINSTPIVLDGRSYMLGIFRDITERKKAEEEIKDYKKKIETLIDSSSDIIFLKDKNFRYLIANKAHEKLFNTGIKDIIGNTDFDFMPKETAEGCRKSDEEALKSENSIERDERVGNRYFHVVKQKVMDEKGNPFGIVAVIRDITERKKAEEELKRSELMLREQKLALEQKNLALKEMIEHIERTKNRMKEDIAINIDETLMPIVEKLKIKGVSPKYIKLLKHHLKELSSSFGRKITQRNAKLTLREVEICNMIKGGLASKDISELLNVSRQTIEKHRKNIRKKLGLSNKKTNLSSYLQNF